MTKPSAHFVANQRRAIRTAAPFDFALFGLGLICIAFLFAMGYFLVVGTIADGFGVSEKFVCGTWIVPPTVDPWPFFDSFLTRWVGPMRPSNPDYIINAWAWPAFIGIAFAFERWAAKPARSTQVKRPST
jgi:hypothetical protein